MTNTGQRGSPGGAGCDCAGDGKQLDPHTHTGMCKVTNRHCQGDPADQVRLPDAPEGYVKAGLQSLLRQVSRDLYLCEK